MILLTVRYRVKPGTRAMVIALAKDMQAYSRGEEGNIEYSQLPAIDDENEMVVIEKWASADAVKAHQSSEMYQRFSEARREYLVQGSMVIQSYDAKEI